jgi:hypothetical protein
MPQVSKNLELMIPELESSGVCTRDNQVISGAGDGAKGRDVIQPLIASRLEELVKEQPDHLNPGRQLG